MKISSLFSAAAFLAATTLCSAQNDTAKHRAAYAAINAAAASLPQTSANYKDEATLFKLNAWSDDGVIQKIVAVCDDDGEGVTEYYLEAEKPLFVFNTYHQLTEDGKRGAKVEERLYFKDGSIFKWLTTEKPAPVFHGEDYAATTEMYTANCQAFLKALKKGKPVKAAAASERVTDGVFVRIDEGDYFHWVMKSKGGEELSFFIMKPDASVDKVIDNPQAYLGKKCRVTWKKSSENIPEAGGKMEIEQILSVQWLGAK